MRLLRLLIGILLLPLCVAVTRAMGALLLSTHADAAILLPAPVWAILGGFLLWLLVYFTLPAPVRTYVLAHELTHALWGALMGEKIFSLSVSRERGSVTLSDTNFLITLAPYFFPLYTILIILAYYVLAIFMDVTPYHLLWLALVGFTWGFHCTFTFSSLLQRQTDIQDCGHVFSYAVIYLFNILGVGLWIVAVTSASLEQFIRLTWIHTNTMAVWLVHAAVLGWKTLSGAP